MTVQDSPIMLATLRSEHAYNTNHQGIHSSSAKGYLASRLLRISTHSIHETAQAVCLRRQCAWREATHEVERAATATTIPEQHRESRGEERR